jgi:membrane protease subunit HflC|tara:strand:+ start:13019 stop:13891 length:873 start_codon:yes stop_codon:yes gene_type:complete
MQIRSVVGLVVIALAVMLGADSIYVVKETERAVVLRFGALVETNVEPGLHFKLPLADIVRKFDGRVLTVDAAPESFFTIQQKRVIVDSYAKWRINDVDTYYKSTGGDERVASDRLASRINDGLRNQFGVKTLHEVVSGKRDELMKKITDQLNTDVKESLGVEVLDVRVKRIDLPVDVSASVFRRMAAEREKEAREYRSEGKEQAEKIRADADRQITIIGAEAYREAQKIKGDGDATASATYADAYNKNPEFYSFTRSLKAYRGSFSSKDDLMVVDPKGDFFKYLKSSTAN